MKLIDADAIIAALESFSDLRNGNTHFLNGIETAKEIVTRLPDAVVRCKDCRYAHMSTDGSAKYCEVWFPDEAEYLDGDNYCSFGERRNNEID